MKSKGIVSQKLDSVCLWKDRVCDGRGYRRLSITGSDLFLNLGGGLQGSIFFFFKLCVCVCVCVCVQPPYSLTYFTILTYIAIHSDVQYVIKCFHTNYKKKNYFASFKVVRVDEMGRNLMSDLLFPFLNEKPNL